MRKIAATGLSISVLAIIVTGGSIASDLRSSGRATQFSPQASQNAPAPPTPVETHQLRLAGSNAEKDPSVIRCDELVAGYAFRDVLDQRNIPIIPIENVNFVEAAAVCGAALDAFPDHLRSKFHYARALEAKSVVSFYPFVQDTTLAEPSLALYTELCANKVALACHNVAAQNLRLGHFAQAAAILEPSCKMDQSPGAGASCDLLAGMYAQGQIGQKKTLLARLHCTRLGADLTTQPPVCMAQSLP